MNKLQYNDNKNTMMMALEWLIKVVLGKKIYKIDI